MMSSLPNTAHDLLSGDRGGLDELKMRNHEEKSPDPDLDKDPNRLLNACLDALLYQDGAGKPFTYSTHDLIAAAKPTIGEANALFIDGIRLFNYTLNPLKYLTEAEVKGCEHPLLYYYLGECYRVNSKGTTANSAKALDDYIKAIKGGCPWAYIGVYNLYVEVYKGTGNSKRGFHYLLDLEREGVTDGRLLVALGDCYGGGSQCDLNIHLGMTYFQRATEVGYVPAWLSQFRVVCDDISCMKYDLDEAVLKLLGAEEKGVGVKDDRILGYIVAMLTDLKLQNRPILRQLAYLPSDQVLGKFENKIEMALHYCDALIQRKSSLGYSKKSDTYKCDRTDKLHPEIPVANWKEADHAGLADSYIYHHLIKAYTDGVGVYVNGLKALEYCEKASLLSLSDDQIMDTFDAMSRVYRDGIQPVARDGAKVLECYERALQMVSGSKTTAMLYERPIAIGMGDVYMDGIHPVPRDGAKALECFEKVLLLDDAFYGARAYGLMAEIYEEGIPPIAKDWVKSRRLRNMRRHICRRYKLPW